MMIEACLMQKEESFKNALNRMEPATKPCGTPEIISLKSLKVVFKRARCLRFFRYE